MPLENDLRIAIDELISIRDLIAEISGLFFDENKFYFIEKRINKRIKATNSQSAKDYFRLLKLGGDQNEIQELLTALTTNETYFYRFLPQLETFAEEALPMVCDEKRKRNDYTLNIWSAACSSGDEAYTLSMILKESLPDYAKWKITIIATDIDHNILKKAKAGVYDKRAVKDIKPELVDKYFKFESGKYHLNSDVKEGITFHHLNLMDRRKLREYNDMDFVFCRNVLIYFDNKSRKQVINSMYDSLNKGGFIFLGHSESLGKISATFKLIKFNKSVSYQK